MPVTNIIYMVFALYIVLISAMILHDLFHVLCSSVMIGVVIVHDLFHVICSSVMIGA